MHSGSIVHQGGQTKGRDLVWSWKQVQSHLGKEIWWFQSSEHGRWVGKRLPVGMSEILTMHKGINQDRQEWPLIYKNKGKMSHIA